MSELDRYAERGRAEREEQQAAEREAALERARSARLLAPLARRALAGDTSLWILPISLVGVGGAVVAFGALTAARIGTPGPEIAAGSWAVAALVVGVVLLRGLGDRRAARELAWLHARPFEADWDAYLRALGEERFTTTVRVRAELVSRLDGAAAQRIADALRGLTSGGDATCSGGVLELRGERIDSHFRGNDDSHYDNKRVHAWVRGALRALERIHAEQPIRRVELELS